MTDSGADLLAGAARALPGPHCALLARLHAFTAERMAAARTCRDRLVKAAARCGCGGPELHAFAREAWEALDGLAREVNVCMHHLFPDLGLYPPTQMTRQCTFYVVRKILHDSPATTHHPVTELLWHESRQGGQPAYERLSFLHNLSLFLPIAPVDGRPGWRRAPRRYWNGWMGWCGSAMPCWPVKSERQKAHHGDTKGTENDGEKTDPN